MQGKKNKDSQWTLRVPTDLDNKLKKTVSQDCNETKSTYIRKAVMEKMEKKNGRTD